MNSPKRRAPDSTESGPSASGFFDPVSVALFAAVAVPVLIAGIRVAASGWTPLSDNAMMATRIFDVLSDRTPLVGQYTLAGGDGVDANSPGPVPYWPLALPVRFGPSWLVPILVSLFNGALLGSSTVLARRRAGTGFAVILSFGLLALMLTHGTAVFTSIWNPWISLAPLLALTFLSWSVLDGRPWMLVPATFLACLVSQAHLTYLPVAGALMVVALVGWWVTSRSKPDEDDKAGGSSARSPSPLIAAAAVAVVCWALPIYEQLSNQPGNLSLLAEGRDQPGGRGGIGAVFGTLWHSLGLSPNWLRDPEEQEFLRRSLETPRPLETVGVILVLVLLGTVVWIACRRGERSLVIGGVVTGALILGQAAVAFTYPTSNAFTAFYAFRWFAFTGLMAWALIITAVGRWLLSSRPHVSPAVPKAVVAAGLVAAILAVGLVLPVRDGERPFYGPARDLGALVLDTTEEGSTYRVERTGTLYVLYSSLMMYELNRNGRHPVMGEPGSKAFGADYAPSGERCDGILSVVAGSEPVPPEGRVVGTLRTPGADGRPTRASLVVENDDSGPPRC